MHLLNFRNVTLATFFLALACTASSGTLAQEFRLKFGKNLNGFHIPQKIQANGITVHWPENEHVIHSIEDLIGLTGKKNDILIGAADDIQNAFAIVDGDGPKARRMIVVDEKWMYGHTANGGQYRLVLAHEVGHQICKHTLEIGSARNWEKELEADRTAAALFRRAFDQGDAIGGDTLSLDAIITSARAYLSGPGSETHPPGDMRIAAYYDGWHNGSRCLNAAYVPINPLPKK